MIADALKLSVYFGDSVATGGALASDALMDCMERRGPPVATLLRGVEGFGANRRMRAAHFPDLSTDLPLLAVAVDEHDRIRGMIEAVDEAVPRGLLTLEHALLATGTDVASAETPDGPGRAAKLSVYCRADERIDGRPADRQVVDILRRHGATGAVALHGVDGVLRGERARLRLFSVRDRPIVMIVSVGPRGLLARCLPRLAEALHDPVVTLEAIAQVKHDGRLLEPLPSVAARGRGEPDLWQAIRVYTRRSAQFDGRALYSELTRRLREAGAAGATTVLGDWGFSSDEPAHGDRLGRIGSQRPSYTVYVDWPERVAEIWPVIDEVTAEHGVVTSVLVPGYRERIDEITRGSLDESRAARGRWSP
jgi:PII-like signaling protein